MPIDHAELVRQYLSNGLTPILPFERDIIMGELDSLADKQEELGQDLHEAMNQSSETWHDNAPAEIVSNQSRNLHRQATALQDLMRRCVDIQYPENLNEKVTLGSIVDVKYNDSTEIETLLVMGYVRDKKSLKDILAAASLGDKYIDVVTLSSPVGKSLLGASAGDTVDYEVDGKVLRLTVLRAAIFPYPT